MNSDCFGVKKSISNCFPFDFVGSGRLRLQSIGRNKPIFVGKRRPKVEQIKSNNTAKTIAYSSWRGISSTACTLPVCSETGSCFFPPKLSPVQLQINIEKAAVGDLDKEYYRGFKKRPFRLPKFPSQPAFSKRNQMTRRFYRASCCPRRRAGHNPCC